MTRPARGRSHREAVIVLVPGWRNSSSAWVSGTGVVVLERRAPRPAGRRARRPAARPPAEPPSIAAARARAEGEHVGRPGTETPWSSTPGTATMVHGSLRPWCTSSMSSSSHDHSRSPSTATSRSEVTITVAGWTSTTVASPAAGSPVTSWTTAPPRSTARSTSPGCSGESVADGSDSGTEGSCGSEQVREEAGHLVGDHEADQEQERGSRRSRPWPGPSGARPTRRRRSRRTAPAARGRGPRGSWCPRP